MARPTVTDPATVSTGTGLTVRWEPRTGLIVVGAETGYDQ